MTLVASAACVELAGVSLTSRLVWVSATLYGDVVRRRCDHAVPPSANGNARHAVPPSAAAERSRRRIKLWDPYGRWASPTFPGLCIVRGDSSPARRAPAPHPPGPRTAPRGGLRPQGGAWGLSYTCVCCDSPPPGASLARRTLHVSRTPHISRTPTSPGLRGCPRSRSAFGAIAFIVGRWGRVSGVLIVSVGRWGRYTTRSALNDARGPVCLNQSCPRGACCWSRGLQRCLRPCRSSGPALPSAWHAKPGCYYVRT